MTDINELPDEVLEFILSQLPPYEDLQECALVCKRWSNLVENVLHRSKINLNKGLSDYQLCWNTSENQKNISRIAGRFSHVAAIHENSMYIFGGGSSTDTTFNDLWRFDLSRRQWVRPVTMGNYPSPKGSATMICYDHKLILFGGWRYPSFYPPHQPWCLFNELHYYDIKENRWTVKRTEQSPPTMAGHSATLHGEQMIIFGGFQFQSNNEQTSSNEIWSLNLKNYQWSKPTIGGNMKPAARYGQFQFALDDEHLLIMGGCGGVNNLFNDCWVLNMHGDTWYWQNIPIRNKKWSASHMWSSPACKIDNKLIIVGPTPSIPNDFQILKQQRPQRNNIQQFIAMERNRFRIQPQDMNMRLIDQQRRAPNFRQLNNNAGAIPPRNNLPNINNNNNNPEELPLPVVPPLVPPIVQPIFAPAPFMQRNSKNNNEAADRLQRNLALRAREIDLKMPVRFNEQQDGRILMAAFHVQQNNIQNASKERHRERLRRLDEKLNQFINAKQKQQQQQQLQQNAQAVIQVPAIVAEVKHSILEEPKPKRIKKNLLGMFVCDITNILNKTDPYVEWIEYKNFGILPGAPERLVFSSLVAGKGELILFGGVQKESLCEMNHKVTNSLHFLTTLKEII